MIVHGPGETSAGEIVARIATLPLASSERSAHFEVAFFSRL
jgi:hypothetical protein